MFFFSLSLLLYLSVSLSAGYFKVNIQICLITNFSCKSQLLSTCSLWRELTFLGNHVFHKPKAVHADVLCSQVKSSSENEMTCHLGNTFAVGMFCLSSWQIHWRHISPWLLTVQLLSLQHGVCGGIQDASALRVCLDTCPQFITR